MTKPVESLFSISHFGFALLLETLLKNEKREKAFSSYYVGFPRIKVSFTPPNVNVGVRYLIFKIIATKNTGTSKQKETAVEKRHCYKNIFYYTIANTFDFLSFHQDVTMAENEKQSIIKEIG